MKPAPPSLWVSYCATCGVPIVAAKSKAVAAKSDGCPCPITANVRVAKYVLAPTPKTTERRK